MPRYVVSPCKHCANYPYCYAHGTDLPDNLKSPDGLLDPYKCGGAEWVGDDDA